MTVLVVYSSQVKRYQLSIRRLHNLYRTYDRKSFKTNDRKIEEDIHFPRGNLHRKHGYWRLGSMEICLSDIVTDLAGAFAGQ